MHRLLSTICTCLTRCLAASGTGAVRRGGRFTFNWLALPILLLLLAITPAAAFDVDNTATVDYVYGGSNLNTSSNPVTVVVTPPPSAAIIEYLRLTADPLGTTLPGTEYSDSDPPGTFASILPAPDPGTLSTAVNYIEGEMVVMRVIDADQNLNPLGLDTVLIRLDVAMSGDNELLSLTETGFNSGIFEGYIYSGTAAAADFDGYLTAPATSLINFSYDDGGPILSLSNPVLAAAAGGSLWLQLTADRNLVAPGDIFTYSLSVENTDITTATAVTVTQQLPAGFRYQSGSTTYNGLPAADPTISVDGSSLTFSVGDLLSTATFDIDFRSMVGAVLPAEYPSNALAQASSGQVSNPADANVLVRDELGNGKNIIAGRVLDGCGNDSGVEGVRIYLEDGTYVLTDKRGRYHVEGITPGTHVVQIDPITLPDNYEVVLCEDHNRFAGNAESRFVELQPGSLWRADFYISDKPINGEVSIALNNSYAPGAPATYTINLSGKDIPFRNRKLEVELPPEATYLPGSSILNGHTLTDPEINNHLLTYTLPDAAEIWQDTVRIRAYIDQNTATGEMLAHARLRFDTPSQADLATPDAESTLVWISRGERAEVQDLFLRPRFDTLEADLTTNDKAELNKVVEQINTLDLIKIYVIGHTDARRIRWHEGILYRDNFELSEARAEAVAKALLEALELNPEQIVSIGMAESVPIADNETVEGMAMNRRTDLRVLHRVIIDPENEKIGTNGGEPRHLKTAPEKTAGVLEEKATEMGILSPIRDSHIAHSVESIRIRIPTKLSPELFYDGKLIPKEKIGFQMNEPETKSQILTFIGIDLGDPGEHLLTIKGIGPFGNVRYESSTRIIRTGEVHRIELAEEQVNFADGRTPVKLKLKLYDEQDHLIQGKVKLEQRTGTLTPLSSEESHLPQAPETDMVWFDSDGFALFEPVTEAGLHLITLGIKEHEVTIEIYVSPEKRDWILVGLGEGTAGYNNISDEVQALDPNAPEEDYYDEGRIAFFAKGQIRGDWLLTLAYDSDKEDLKDRSLNQIIDPNTYYTIYGDNTVQGYEAASAEKLYVRIERDRFYALFGDMNTGLNVTELARYNRSLTGFKSEFNGKRFGYSAFASETAQNFVRDEIQGDGTSGLYYLSGQDLVLNSEKIVLETRDRYHSEKIIESKTLQRSLDYDIDFAAGTLFFKEPIPSRDQNMNPIFITVDYETGPGGDQDYTYGGRAYGRLDNGKVEIGASLIHQGQNAVESDLYGVDANIRLTDTTTISGEWATSETSTPTQDIDGDAWLTAIEHRSRLLDANFYLREQESNFGLGQQNASESGTRKIGGNVVYRLTQKLDLGAEAYQQENLATDLKRQVEEVDVRYNSQRYNLTAGLRHAEDELASGQTETSDQLILGADYQATNRLNLRLRQEQSFGNNENRDYPSRTLLGADYQLSRAVSLFAEQEFTYGDSADTANTRVGLNATPWDGGQIRTSMEQNLNESGRRVFGNLGLTQTWQVNPKLSVSLSADRSQVLSGENKESFHPDQPPAAGSTEDFSAYSTGFSYREIDWTFDSRIEVRNSDSEDKWGLYASSYVEPHSYLGLSLYGSYYTTDRSNQSSSDDADLSFGLAYRPHNRRWIVLNRLDLIASKNESATQTTEHWKIIERLNAFWRANEKNRLTFKFGTRYADDDYDTVDYSGTTWLFGSEWRHDLSPRTDIGLHGAILQVQELSQSLYQTGVSFGYSPAKNFWISVGYNVNGFQDEDFSKADYTAQGPFVKFRFKFDQNSVRDAVKWLKSN